MLGSIPTYTIYFLSISGLSLLLFALSFLSARTRQRAGYCKFSYTEFATDFCHSPLPLTFEIGSHRRFMFEVFLKVVHRVHSANKNTCTQLFQETVAFTRLNTGKSTRQSALCEKKTHAIFSLQSALCEKKFSLTLFRSLISNKAIFASFLESLPECTLGTAGNSQQILAFYSGIHCSYIFSVRFLEI